jgi:hypothetical protein
VLSQDGEANGSRHCFASRNDVAITECARSGFTDPFEQGWKRICTDGWMAVAAS